jgi:chorismate dehydratase
MSFTLGVVPYLNAIPLIAALPDFVRVERGVPSELASRLAAGALDAALLPTAEAIRGAFGPFVGRFGIACDGAVDSVLAFVPREGPPSDWPTDVVLDPASRTSVALLRVLLERRHGLTPVYRTAPTPGPDPRDFPGAMTLTIGDRALAVRRGYAGHVIDLGAEWKAWTGLPFVFARWTSRPGAPATLVEALARTLDGAAQRGLEQRAELAADHGPAHGLTAVEARRYLSTSIRFALGERAEAGFARFADEVRRLDGASR